MLYYLNNKNYYLNNLVTIYHVPSKSCWDVIWQLGPFKTKSPKPALSLSCCALFLLKRRRLRLLQPRLYVPRLSEAFQLLTPKFKRIQLCVSVRIHGNTTAQSRRTPNPTRPTRTQYHRNQTHSGPALSVSLSLSHSLTLSHLQNFLSLL